MSVLDAIAAASVELDDIDTQLSQAIAGIEVALRDRIRTRVSIEISAPFASLSALAFGKHGGKWQLIATMGGQEHPLLSCARATRAEVLAGGHLDRLVRESVAQINAQIESRSSAIAAARVILAALNKE